MIYRDVLVTGGSGFIGSHLMEILPEATNVDLKVGSDIRTDLPNIDFKYVFHLAALKSIPRSEESPKEFIDTNCWGTMNVLRKYQRARVINVSSSSVNEVKSVYGATKQFSEAIGSMHPNCLNVRLYNVFGEGQLPKSGAILPRFIDALLNGMHPTIFGDGSQSRDFTYVKDVTLALYSLMFVSGDVGTVHLGYSSSLTVNQLLEDLNSLMGTKGTPLYTSARRFDIYYSQSPTEMPIHYGRTEGLKRTIKWFKDFKNEASKPRV